MFTIWLNFLNENRDYHLKRCAFLDKKTYLFKSSYTLEAKRDKKESNLDPGLLSFLTGAIFCSFRAG